jgi:hypothetical protein
VIVLVPHKFAAQLYQLYVLVVQFRNHLWTPLVIEARKFFQ